MEELITFVVPVHGDSGLYLPRCIHSLLDQDYDNKNIVVVYDGANQMRGALSQENAHQNDNRIKFITIKEQVGAPNARNVGMDNATGDVICFFDCDSLLRSGAIRTWMQTFKDNPRCGFVYGGYRFTMRDNYSNGVPSKPFDEYLLTCNNYISTMNPIKREHVVKWDDELKSLQDWDFWLRVVKNGVIGKFIPEILVISNEIQAEGISGDCSRNWIERYNKVRKKNGITGRDKAFVTFGAPFQTLRRAKICNADYRDPYMLINHPHDYKAIISMGYYVETQNCGPSAIFNQCKPNCKKIAYWIGTDVLQLSNQTWNNVSEYSKRFAKNIDHQFCNAPWLQEELKAMGFDAELLYCPIDANNYEITPLPENFTVAIYRQDIPGVGNNPVYNEDLMVEIATAMPDVQFRFFGGKIPPHEFVFPDNIKYVGTLPEREMKSFIESTSAIVRMTKHDGFPATIAEWIMSGRRALCNLKDMPYTQYLKYSSFTYNHVKEKESLVEAIRHLQEKSISSNEFEYDKKRVIEARNYYAELLKPETFVKRINEVVNGKKD